MELFRTDSHYIFVKERHSLWCEKFTGELSAKSDWEWTSANNIECLGILYGIIGKIEQPSVLEPRLMLIKEISNVGELHGGHVVYKVKSVAFLHLGIDHQDVGLLPCKKHEHMTRKKSQLSFSEGAQKLGFAKTWGTIKSATNTIKNTTQQAAALATSQVKSTVIKRSPGKDKEKFEKRLVEELNKIFTETDSFFFCHTGDITNSLQRQCLKEKKTNDGDVEKMLWTNVDDRFFWNKHMLQDIINLKTEAADQWILPIIQGYIQIEQIKVQVGYDDEPLHEIFNLAIISRRSRFRAGTRYKRRGVDENGKCANYVETEQLVWYHDHQVSFVQIRGSVPVFWSQPGYKYKPPPRIDKDEASTQVAFEKHFVDEFDHYGPICIVNLVEQAGREKIIWDAYGNHILKFNHPDITYATFDFHEYCRGMHFENVSILILALAEVIANMGYCWRDKQGIIFKQKSAFRVNCIDCLDRTNVVQTALGKAVMEIQFSKLGMIPPEGTLPTNIRQTFQLLWANNGDIISKQYAGTNALKGDYTRTGERKFTGLMKDGMNSANRYVQQHFLDDIRQAAIDTLLGYPIELEQLKDDWSHYVEIFDHCCRGIIPAKPPNIPLQLSTHPDILYATAMYNITRYYLNRFKDVYRQATIDMMLGHSINEDIFQERTEEEDNAATAVHVKLLIEDCKKLLIPDPESILGSWGLIDADPVTGDPTETEMDKILILTRDSYYVADYDDQIDKVTNYQRVPLTDVVFVEYGQPDTTVSIFKNKNHHCIRINYKMANEYGYFHMFRSTNLRFFNNMAIVIKTEEEIIESLKTIAETISVAFEVAGLPKIPVAMNVTLDKRKSKLVNVREHTGLLDISLFPELGRNVSETQMNALKSAGTKALSNVTEQFSKLSHTFTSKKPMDVAKGAQHKNLDSTDKPLFTVGNRDISGNISQKPESVSGSSSEDDIDKPFSAARPEDMKPNNFQFDKKVMEAYTPSVGIILGVKCMATGKETCSILDSDNLAVDRLDLMSLSDSKTNTSSPKMATTPEITIEGIGESLSSNEAVPLSKNMSHSSSEVDGKVVTSNLFKNTLMPESGKLMDKKRSTSERDLVLSISSSQSESALKSMKLKSGNASSPVALTAKEIFSPFSKLAKGVQTLGANLDPRKLKPGQTGLTGNLSDNHLEEQKKLEEKWIQCRSKLIAL